MDYNGDGKTDICLININGLYVYEFTGDGFRQLAYSSAINIMYFNFESPTIKDRELMVADMNGDGNMDIILGPAVYIARKDSSIWETVSVMAHVIVKAI